jgi:hypothetical protein
MENETPSWLPALLLFENYQGNWECYIHAVHQRFHQDFVVRRPSFEQLPIFIRSHPVHEKKGATFWHLISEGSEEAERTPDLRRCERISWPRPLIEETDAEEVKVWETIRPWKNQQQRRINFSLDNFSYIVVIAETHRGFDLVTAFYVERMHRREKLRKEYETSKQKKVTVHSYKKRGLRC